MITLDIPAFRVAFPQFANVTDFPDIRIQAQWDVGTGFVSADTYGDMSVAVRTYAIQLATAHLLTISVIVASGNSPGVVTMSKVGDVTVQLAAPPFGTSQWRYWLSLTPYGAQLVALLDAQSVGGFMVGGLPERSAFRRVGGGFGGAC